MSERPTRLVTLSILALVLAGFGLLSSLSGIASLAVPNLTRRMVPSTSNAKVHEIQQRMAVELTEATRKWRGYQIAVLIGVLLSSVALLIGGIKSLNVQNPGPFLLRTTMAILIPLEIAKTWLALAVASAMSSIMARYTAEIVNVRRHRWPTDADRSCGDRIRHIAIRNVRRFSFCRGLVRRESCAVRGHHLLLQTSRRARALFGAKSSRNSATVGPASSRILSVFERIRKQTNSQDAKSEITCGWLPEFSIPARA